MQPWELFVTYWTNEAPHLCRPLLHHSWRSQAAPRPTHLSQTRWWRRWWLEYLCHELCLTVCQVCTFGHSSDLPQDNRIFEQCSKKYFETAKNHVSTRCKRSVFFGPISFLWKSPVNYHRLYSDWFSKLLIMSMCFKIHASCFIVDVN